jgi:hypothetical protein
MDRCKHKDGWVFGVFDKDAVISEYFDNESLEAEFQCNHFGCKRKRRFRFDIVNLREVE